MLSRQATQGWMKAANGICKDRVKKACFGATKNLNVPQLYSCVHDQLQECYKYNTDVIQRDCLKANNQQQLLCLQPDLV